MLRVIKKLVRCRKEGRTLRSIEERMDATGETQVSPNDPDCWAMAIEQAAPVLWDGVQGARFDRRRRDRGNPRQGSRKGEEIVACDLAGIAVSVSKPHFQYRSGGVASTGLTSFLTWRRRLTSVQPCGWLPYHYATEQDGKTRRDYWTKNCVTCLIKHGCCTRKARVLHAQGAMHDKAPLRSKTDGHRIS